jgi:Lrp/AsnC family transcriptional regulator for asnA, asnC and gidA
MVMIDKLNERLIELLSENARQSSDALARKLNTSPATIRRRLRRLIQSGVLRIVAVADANKIGLPLTAVISLDVNHEKLDSAIKMLTDRPEVKWVSTTTGRFDIIIIARFASTDDLASFVQKELAKVEGLRDSETFVCLQISKGRFTGVSPH